MTKQDVALQIAAKTSVSSDQAVSVINAFTDIVKQALTTGDPVTIRGFGSFKPVTKARKTARNISTKQVVIIPEHTAPRFFPSKEFIEQVRGQELVAEL